MPNYAIGDVQGCFLELQQMLEKINFNRDRDKLWFTGDLVNRGPDSLKTLRFVKELQEKNLAITVLGNHELHLLAVVFAQATLKPKDTLDEILQAPDCLELCHWLRQQPLLHHDAMLGYTMIHAGLAPQWNLRKAITCAQEVENALRNSSYKDFLTNLYGNMPACWNEKLTGWERLRLITNYLTRIRFCDALGTLELDTKGESHLSPTGFLPWFKIPSRENKNLKIIFGHWAALQGITNEPNVFALDTGCVWGNSLSAMRLEDEVRFFVPAVT